MKKNFITLITICLFSEIFGQTFYDPYVGVLIMTPSSPYSTSNPPFVPVTGTATINLGSNAGGNSPIQWGSNTHIPDGGGCTTSDCKLQINISTTDPYTIITGTPSGGNWTNKFTWFKSGNYLLIGTQKDSTSGGSIAVNSSGTIIVPIQHILPSKISDPVGQTHPCNVPGNNCTIGFTQGYNGIVVNIQPPSFPSVDNQPTANDNNGAYVYARTLLPIQYIEFNSIDKQSSGIQLNWKTLNEQNTLAFEIERKYSNEETWMTIGKTPAAGQSSKELTYSYSDVTYAQRDKIYYRIKQVDVDGTFTYTDIKGIELKKNSQVKLDGFPNPVKDLYHLTITGAKDDKVSIDVFDILGRSVSRKTLSIVKGSNYHDLNMGTYTPGTYIVRVSSAEINESMTVVKVD